ncbi:MAG TPA: hypothetical protein VHA09_09190 [Nitrososphaera sp.]|nr:hypothetical protein [Nitrososphaera sp.]
MTTTDEKEEGEDDIITKEALKPITKVHSKLDKELQEVEVESTKGGMNGG